MIKSTLFLLIVAFLFSCSEKKQETTEAATEIKPTNKVVLSSEIEWEKLNPARGDKSPQAGTIWGDRHGEVPTGFLAKFVDGFSSPPHIHNITYRAVVIKGSIHNDDPSAAQMWMQPGSFWTQPVGESHITAAKGEENMAYVEIDNGPYLVQPGSDAYETNEKPINIDVSNVIWLDNERSNWIDKKCDAKISYLWETKNNGIKGMFVKLPKNFDGTLESDGNIFYSIVIQGKTEYLLPQDNSIKTLDLGSCFSSTDTAKHILTNKTDDFVLLYVRTNGSFYIK